MLHKKGSCIYYFCVQLFIEFFSVLSADGADVKNIALLKQEISSEEKVSTPSQESSDLTETSSNAEKTTAKTFEERAQSAAKAAGYTSLCLSSLYIVYTLLGKAIDAYKLDPYAVLPVQSEKYFKEARLENIIFRPCRIAAALGLSTIIIVAHYKFKFYNEARKHLRSMFAN